jgi:hypothetical protein
MEADSGKVPGAQAPSGHPFERALLREKRARLRAEELLEQYSKESFFAVQKLKEFQSQSDAAQASEVHAERQMRPIVLALLLALWVAAVGAGMAVLWHYAAVPGNAAAAPRQWPGQSALTRRPGWPTLVVLVHPKCPCTRATLEALSGVLTRCRDGVTAHVLCYRPREAPEGWERTDLWQRAEAIPGVTIHRDDDGIEAARFGAETSGQVLLYDPEGRLLFRGGITLARGHRGDNLGSRQLIELASGRPARAPRPDVAEHPVFGCPLFGRVPSEQALDRPEGTTGEEAR